MSLFGRCFRKGIVTTMTEALDRALKKYEFRITGEK